MYSKKFCIRVFWVVCLLIVFIWSSTVLAAQRWYKDYQQAVEFAKKGDWLTTIELLQRAKKKDSTPKKKKKTYGPHSIPYYPYLKLGQAYLAIARIPDALKYCNKSKVKSAAPKPDVTKCLKRAQVLDKLSTTRDSRTEVAKKQKKLKDLFQDECIQPEHFGYALKILESGKSNQWLNKFLEGKISSKDFNSKFKKLLPDNLLPKTFKPASTCDS